MGTLNEILSSPVSQPGVRVVIAALEKIGKTTFGCSAPRVLLMALEQGWSGIKLGYNPPQPKSFDELMDLLDEIIQSSQAGTFQFKSILFDSATALEKLIHAKTLSTDPLWKNGNPKGLIMDNALGGYGKAYNFSNELFGDFLAKCDMLANFGGINIIFTCHVFAGKVVDPAYGEYDTWDLLLHSPKNNKTYGKREMLTQWADIVGFLHEPLFVSKEKGSDLSRGVSANKGRVLGLERTPGYVAGNRYGIKGEITIPAEGSWNYLAQAIHEASSLDVYNRD